MFNLHWWQRSSRALLSGLCVLALGAGCGKDKQEEESAEESESAPAEEKAEEPADEEAKPGAKEPAAKEAKPKEEPAAAPPAKEPPAVGDPGPPASPAAIRERRRKRNEERRAPMAAGRPPGAPTPNGAPATRPEPAPREAPGTRPTTPPVPHPEEPPVAPGAAAHADPDEPVPPPAGSAEAGLDISQFLNVEDVRKIAGERAMMPIGALPGILASPYYNSTYFAPPKRAEFGVSLQVWRERTRRDANERFRRMKRDYPNAQDTTSVAANGFFSSWQDIMTLSFMNFEKRTIVSVSCSAKLCSQAKLLELATSVKGRI
jgi:hypothetical protein